MAELSSLSFLPKALAPVASLERVAIGPDPQMGVGVTVEATDAQLVQRAQSGDRTAFDLLVLKYQHRIHKLVGRFVNDPAEAQDVTQDAFIKAYRALRSFRNDSAFYTWMYRIAINTAK